MEAKRPMAEGNSGIGRLNVLAKYDSVELSAFIIREHQGSARLLREQGYQC